MSIVNNSVHVTHPEFGVPKVGNLMLGGAQTYFFGNIFQNRMKIVD